MTDKSLSYQKGKARTELLRATAKNMGTALSLSTSQRVTNRPGINLVAPKNRDTGIGFYAGIMNRISVASGRSVQNYHFDQNIEVERSIKELFETTIAVVSPGQIPFAQMLYPRAFMNRNYRTAIVFWDVDKIPKRFGLGFNLLDEIWLPSQSSADAFARQFKIPTQTFRTPIEKLENGIEGQFRNFLGINDEFLVAYQFDMGSSAMRKNPWAAVRAYKLAFPNENEGAIMILKCSRATENSNDWLLLKSLCEGRRDIILINEFWEADMIASMYLDIDCYFSTHRSEGFGLTVAHALAADKYVIATNFGATTEFMPPEYSGLIPFDLIKIGPNPVYPEDATWADPEVEAAAELLYRAFSDPEKTKWKGQMAGEWTRREFSLDKSVESFTGHLEAK